MMLSFNSTFIALILLFSHSAFAAANLNCEQLKLSPQFYNPKSETPLHSWTEDQRLIGTEGHHEGLIKIINSILDYQNMRTSLCPRAKQSTYASLYKTIDTKKRSTIKISVGIGYNDQRPSAYVWDSYLLKIMTIPLMMPCSNSWSQNCGFGLEEMTANEVTVSKTIWGNKKLIISFFSSALTEDDDKNRYNVKQIEKSEKAQKTFFDSFQSADFVFYLGHSRSGGGPDFFPPRILDSSKETDYAWYKETRENKTAMIEALQKLPVDKKPAMIALLGCSSQLHFYRKLKEAAPHTTFFLSRQTIYTLEFFQGLFTFINGVQLRKTVEEFNVDLEATNIAHRSNGQVVVPMLFLLGGRK